MFIPFLLSFFFLKFIFSSYCGSYIPKDESTCDRYTNTTHICCHLTGHLSGTYQQMCYPFSREDYYRMSRTIAINNYDFKLNCGHRRGASCGTIVNPRSYKDCSIASKKSNSCCYYKYQGSTNCVWLGKSDVGTMKYKDLIVICGGRYNKENVTIVLIVLFLLL